MGALLVYSFFAFVSLFVQQAVRNQRHTPNTNLYPSTPKPKAAEISKVVSLKRSPIYGKAHETSAGTVRTETQPKRQRSVNLPWGVVFLKLVLRSLASF